MEVSQVQAIDYSVAILTQKNLKTSKNCTQSANGYDPRTLTDVEHYRTMLTRGSPGGVFTHPSSSRMSLNVLDLFFPKTLKDNDIMLLFFPKSSVFSLTTIPESKCSLILLIQLGWCPFRNDDSAGNQGKP